MPRTSKKNAPSNVLQFPKKPAVNTNLASLPAGASHPAFVRVNGDEHRRYGLIDGDRVLVEKPGDPVDGDLCVFEDAQGRKNLRVYPAEGKLFGTVIGFQRLFDREG